MCWVSVPVCSLHGRIFKEAAIRRRELGATLERSTFWECPSDFSKKKTHNTAIFYLANQPFPRQFFPDPPFFLHYSDSRCMKVMNKLSLGLNSLALSWSLCSIFISRWKFSWWQASWLIRIRERERVIAALRGFFLYCYKIASNPDMESEIETLETDWNFPPRRYSPLYTHAR